MEWDAAQKAKQKKPAGSSLPIALGGFGFFLIAGIFVVLAFLIIKWLAPPASPVATKAPMEKPTATEVPVEKPAATEAPLAATEAPAQSDMTGEDGMIMLYVPEGSFTMGSDADDALAECQKFRTDCSRDWFTNEEPPHSVYLDAFWIDETEVTNAMYAKCVSEGACMEPTDASSYTNPSYYGNSKFDNYPVIYVDWNMANTYCSWAGRELPTEAEWEKAARGTDGNIYPWGNTFDGTALNFCDVNCSFDWSDKSLNDKYADVSPVGNYPSGQSAYGAYDMAGNVWEWVNDWYDVYPGGDANASTDFGQTYRVLRGGSWDYINNYARSANRNRGTPVVTNYFVGFRCARGTSP
jgi:serine/threonine-protein kinase